MATNLDIELNAGVLVDVAQVTKAGQQMRDILSKYVLGSLGSIGIRGTGISKYLDQATNAKSGLEIFSAYRNALTELKQIKSDVTKMSSGFGGVSQKDMEIFNAVSDTLGVAVNTSRRLNVYGPINEKIAAQKKSKKEAIAAAVAAAQTTPGVSDYSGSLFPGSSDVSQTIYKNTYGAGLSTTERTAAAVDAMSAFGSVDASPDRISQAIYRNIYSKGFTADERARAEEDARAVWAVRDNTKALKGLTVVATNVVAAGIKAMTEVIPTYWHENVTRSTFGRLEAEVARTKSVGQFVGTSAGSAIGGILGGVAGFLAGGPLGASVGSIYGAEKLASVGGKVGAMWGDYKGERLQSVKRSIQQIQQRYRAYGIYGGQYGVGYANTVAETGMASASDVEKMTHNSATLGARMMFGQVGENEMLMYSLMPGYFAAAMSGASSEKLAEAFAADIDKLPPQLKVWAAENVGGGSLGMMAFANSPNFGYVQAHAGETRAYDAAQMLAGAGFQVQSGVRGMIDRRAETSALYSDVAYAMGRPRAGIWQPADYGAELALTESKIGQVYPWMARRAYANAERYITSSDPETVAKGMGIANRATQRVLQTINVNIDGETVKSQENVITEDELNGGYSLSYTLGM